MLRHMFKIHHAHLRLGVGTRRGRVRGLRQALAHCGGGCSPTALLHCQRKLLPLRQVNCTVAVQLSGLVVAHLSWHVGVRCKSREVCRRIVQGQRWGSTHRRVPAGRDGLQLRALAARSLTWRKPAGGWAAGGRRRSRRLPPQLPPGTAAAVLRLRLQGRHGDVRRLPARVTGLQDQLGGRSRALNSNWQAAASTAKCQCDRQASRDLPGKSATVRIETVLQRSEWGGVTRKRNARGGIA